MGMAQMKATGSGIGRILSSAPSSTTVDPVEHPFRRRRCRRSRPAATVGLISLTLIVSQLVAGPVAAATPVRSAPLLVGEPSSLVNPMAGTGTGPTDPGTVGEFPGGVPALRDDPVEPGHHAQRGRSGGGYSSADSTISGFSLTHLSGTGCASYGDVPVLPTVGPVGTDPEATTATFSHADEHAAPGSYARGPGSSEGDHRPVRDDQDRTVPVHLPADRGRPMSSSRWRAAPTR